MRPAWSAAWFVVASVVAAGAQQREAEPAFEVASVKRNTGGDTRSYWRLVPQGQIAITNGDLRRIISRAYGLDDRRMRYLLVGAPDDILAARFDIRAKPPDGSPAGTTLPMLQKLLHDRFKLRIRNETRQMPIYELKDVPPGRRFGPHLRPSAHDCTPGGTTRPPREVCTVDILWSATERNAFGARLLVGQRIYNAGPFSRLVSDIQAFVDRPLVDATGITGKFEWQLTASNPGIGSSEHPTIFSAVQEQLGLKLESARGPVDVLAIDSLEWPTPD